MSLVLLLLFAQAEFPKSSQLPPTNGYSHIVVAPPGRMVFIAGQVAMDATGKLIGIGDMRAQTEKALDNLKIALAAAGADFSQVVKINWYVKGLTPEKLAVVREVRSRYLNVKTPPASTLAGVAELFLPDALIEVEAIAVIPLSALKP